MSIEHVYRDRTNFTDRARRFARAHDDARREAIGELRFRSEIGTRAASSGLLSTFFSLVGVMAIAAINLVVILSFTSDRFKEGRAELAVDLAYIVGFFVMLLVLIVLVAMTGLQQYRQERSSAVAAMWLAEYERIDQEIRSRRSQGARFAKRRCGLI